jgi:hypothetical protein
MMAVTVTTSENYSILHEVVYFSAAETSRTSSAFNLDVTTIVFVITVIEFDIYTWLLIYRVVHTGSNLMRIAWQHPNRQCLAHRPLEDYKTMVWLGQQYSNNTNTYFNLKWFWGRYVRVWLISVMYTVRRLGSSFTPQNFVIWAWFLLQVEKEKDSYYSSEPVWEY